MHICISLPAGVQEIYFRQMMTTIDSNFQAPLDDESFARPTRQSSQRFGVIGPGRPSGSVIPHFPPSISSADFTSPSFQAVHKAEIDAEIFREKLNVTLSSRISSPPKVSTAPTDNVFSTNEVFDGNQPPALSFKDALESDCSFHIAPPPPSAPRVDRKPFSILFDERQSARRFSQERNHTNSPSSESAYLAILEPKPRLAWYTTYEQLLISSSKEASGNWSTTIKTYMPRGLARLRTKAPHQIDLWLANKPNEPPARILVPVKGGSERPCFPRTPLMKNVPLPETTPSGGCTINHRRCT